MKEIVFESKHKEGVKGLYNGQPYHIDFNLNKDILGMLSSDEVKEVIDAFDKEITNPSSMLGINIGSFVRVNIFEGGDIFQYELEVMSIDEQGFDDEGNYFCVAYGVGITKSDEELAEEFTHRIEQSNFTTVLI